MDFRGRVAYIRSELIAGLQNDLLNSLVVFAFDQKTIEALPVPLLEVVTDHCPHVSVYTAG